MEIGIVCQGENGMQPVVGSFSAEKRKRYKIRIKMRHRPARYFAKKYEPVPTAISSLLSLCISILATAILLPVLKT